MTVNGADQTAKVTCPPETRLLSGGFEWVNENGAGANVIRSSPAFAAASPFQTWEAVGRVDAGGVVNTLVAEALCLSN